MSSEPNPSQLVAEAATLELLVRALDQLKALRTPGRLRPRERHLAVTVTEMEKVVAYYKTYVLDEWRFDEPDRPQS